MATVLRPHYERPRDLDHEARLIALACAAWQVTAHKLSSRAYGLDYELLRQGETVAFAEAKQREFGFGDGDGYRIALQKVVKADALTATSKKPCVMVIGFREGMVRWADFSKRGKRIILAGRTDRGDPADLEPHCIYPWSVFHEVQ